MGGELDYDQNMPRQQLCDWLDKAGGCCVFDFVSKGIFNEVLVITYPFLVRSHLVTLLVWPIKRWSAWPNSTCLTRSGGCSKLNRDYKFCERSSQCSPEACKLLNACLLYILELQP